MLIGALFGIGAATGVPGLGVSGAEARDATAKPTVREGGATVAADLSETAAVRELEALSASLRERYDTIPHITPTELTRLLADPTSDVLLLDARETEEYDVSHISGAIRADPGQWRWTFMSTFGDDVRDKIVVIYCSVGVRSSRLAEHVVEAARAAGAREVYNLAGGIFGWHNRAMPLVDASGSTAFVHPYDEDWGRLVARRELWRFQR